MYELLLNIYQTYGLYKESLLSVTKKGKDGAEEIKKMMDNFRQLPPKQINGSDVVMILDYQLRKSFDKVKGTEGTIELPKSNVLQFITKDGTKISVRPSGTEPKIKFYFGVKEKLATSNDFEKVNQLLDQKIQNIISDLKLK